MQSQHVRTSALTRMLVLLLAGTSQYFCGTSYYYCDCPTARWLEVDTLISSMKKLNPIPMSSSLMSFLSLPLSLSQERGFNMERPGGISASNF